MAVVMRILGRAMAGGWQDSPESGKYLRDFNPDAFDGTGAELLVRDPKQALRFATAAEALRVWQTTSTVQPRRPDGLPNRPLTAYSVELVSAPSAVR